MNWRIFVTKGSGIRYCGGWTSGNTRSANYALNEPFEGHVAELSLKSVGDVGEFYETEGWHRPALPPNYEPMLIVTRVTGVGAPPHSGITPGMYEVQGEGGSATANVRKNGDKLKVELDAPSIELAWMVYRAVLVNSDQARLVAY